MKKIILLILTIFLGLVILLCVIFRNQIMDLCNGYRGDSARGMTIKDNVSIKEFKYSENIDLGYFYTYRLFFKNNKYFVEIKYARINDDEPYCVEVDSDFADDILKVIKKYNANKWHGFNKHNIRIMDGLISSLHVVFSDDTRIDVSGRNCFPNDYRDFGREIEKLFSPFLEDVLSDKNL